MCCTLATVATAQTGSPAKPIAQHSFDVDGDGKADTITIAAPASVTITLAAKPKQPIWKPFAAAGQLLGGSITAAKIRRSTVIVATAELRVGGKRVHEAVAFRYARGRLTTVLRERVGPQGEDGEWSKHLAATPAGLLRYQGAPRIRRCDGKAPHLFPEKYDWRRRKFQPTQPPVNVNANAPRLTATVTPPANASASTRPIAFRTTAATVDGSSTTADDLSAPRELEDGRLNTAWLVDNRFGGRGEFVSYRSSMTAAAVRAFRVLPAQMKSSNTVTDLAILVGSTAYRVHVPAAAAGGYWIVLPKPVAARCVTVIVDRVKRSRAGRTAIAELYVLTDLELAPGGPDAALAGFVAGGGARAGAAMRALRRRGKVAAAALVKEIAARGKAIEKLRLRRALATLRAPAGAAELVEGLATPGLNKHDYAGFSRALARMGNAAIKPLRNLIRRAQATLASRKAALAALSRIPDHAAAEALHGLMGEGSRRWRAHLATTTGNARPVKERLFWIGGVIKAGKPGAAKREADLWQMLRSFRARASGRTADWIAQQVSSRLRATHSMTPEAGYELRYRLFQIAGGSSSVVVASQLDRTIKALAPKHVNSHALLRVATNALGRNPIPEAKRILLGLASNPDPGVRRAVALAFGDRKDVDSTTDNALGARLKTDAWPRVRTAAASSLSLRCKLTTVASMLYHSMDLDKDLRVQRVAISSLVRCRANGILARLFKLANTRKRDIGIRIHAVNEIATLGDRSKVGELIKMFKGHRREAWSKTAALRLASASAVTLGRLGGNLAIGPLMKAARENAFPEIQAAAVTGLSHICPRNARRVFAKLIGSNQRQVSVAARKAMQKCFRRR